MFGKFLFWLVMFFVFVLLLLLKLQIELNGSHQRFACLKPREVALFTLFNHEEKRKNDIDAKKEKTLNLEVNKKNIRYSLLGPAWKSAQRCICLNYLA